VPLPFGVPFRRKTLHSRIDVDKIDPGWIEWSTAEFDKVPLHVAIAQHDMTSQGDLYPRLADVKTPALIIAGANSRIAPREQMERCKVHCRTRNCFCSNAIVRASHSWRLSAVSQMRALSCSYPHEWQTTQTAARTTAPGP
jgi:hypothetical protein